MVLKLGFAFYLLFICTISLHAQYSNTDSLIVVPGEPLPLPVSEVEKQGINLHGPDYDQSLTTGIMLSKFMFPHKNKIISRFGPRRGRMHNGTDIRMAKLGSF